MKRDKAQLDGIRYLLVSVVFSTFRRVPGGASEGSRGAS